MKHIVFTFVFVTSLALLNSCGSEVNRIMLQLENDFHGLVEIRATPSSSNLFAGEVKIPSDGYIEVAEERFSGEMRIRAELLDGTPLSVDLIRNEAPMDAYGVWQYGSGAFVHYFYVGSRSEAEIFYKEIRERLYQIPESRLRRGDDGEFELIVPEN